MAELRLENIVYRYHGTKKEILKGVNASFSGGTVSAICGQSGAGKSTLLYLLSGLDVPTGGKLLLNDTELKKDQLDAYRRHTVATISQSYLLFPTRTALENVCYPMQLAKVPKGEAEEMARAYLNTVGIRDELHGRLPKKLSGGEQQRVAIARCLAANSEIIAADEPTGNLDEKTAQSVMDLLLQLAHEQGNNIIIVTHDRHIVKRADQRLRLEYGLLSDYDED